MNNRSKWAAALCAALLAVGAQAADKKGKKAAGGDEVHPRVARGVTSCVKQKCLKLLPAANKCKREAMHDSAGKPAEEIEKLGEERKAQLQACVEPYSACSKACSEAALAKAAKKKKVVRKGGGEEDGDCPEGKKGEADEKGAFHCVDDVPTCSQETLCSSKDRGLERCDRPAMCYWNCSFDDDSKEYKCICM